MQYNTPDGSYSSIDSLAQYKRLEARGGTSRHVSGVTRQHIHWQSPKDRDDLDAITFQQAVPRICRHYMYVIKSMGALDAFSRPHGSMERCIWKGSALLPDIETSESSSLVPESGCRVRLFHAKRRNRSRAIPTSHRALLS
jgi:hypothetical protein